MKTEGLDIEHLLKEETLKRRFDKFDDSIKFWINQETMYRSVDVRRKLNIEWNKQKKWWQASKPTRFKLDSIPRPLLGIELIITHHADYEAACDYLEDYITEFEKMLRKDYKWPTPRPQSKK